MKERHRWSVRLAAAALVCVPLIGAALAAGQQGSQGDPLVTLSYLEKKATPAFLEQVDVKIAQREVELKGQLSAIVDQYVEEVETLIASGGTSSGGSSGAPGGTATGAYQVVTLSPGQTVTGSGACEFLLRTGTAVCVSDSAPGLVDVTGGGTLAGGGALTPNHLYLGTIAGRGVRASTQVTIMVRGGYVIS